MLFSHLIRAATLQQSCTFAFKYGVSGNESFSFLFSFLSPFLSPSLLLLSNVLPLIIAILLMMN